MKRDDDLIRALLIEAEETEDGLLIAILSLTPDSEDEKRYIHAKWLADDGFFEEVQSGVFRMKNKGNDYLASIRSEGIWQKTKATAADMGGVSLGVLKDIAVGYVKQEVSARLGFTV